MTSEVINLLETASTSESSSSSPFPPYLRHGYYRITAVAARPKPNTRVSQIMEGIALGEFGRRHNGKFFCHCAFCCSKCNGTTFLKLTRVHEDGIPYIPLEVNVIN